MITLIRRFFTPTPKIENSSSNGAYKVPVHSTPSVRRNQLPYPDPILRAQAVFFRNLIDQGNIEAIDRAVDTIPLHLYATLKAYVLYADNHPSEEFELKVDHAFEDDRTREEIEERWRAKKSPEYLKLQAEINHFTSMLKSCTDPEKIDHLNYQISYRKNDQMFLVDKYVHKYRSAPRKPRPSRRFRKLSNAENVSFSIEQKRILVTGTFLFVCLFIVSPIPEISMNLISRIVTWIKVLK